MANLLAYGEKVIGTTGSVVEWTQTQASGTKIAEIDIDGTTTDVYAPSGGGGGSLNYSTTEQVVGTWIDGKPVYQKTYNITTPSNGNAVAIISGLVDIKLLINISGMVDGRVSVNWFFATNRYVSTWNYNNSIWIVCSKADEQGKDAYITLLYTKTTD